jgi:hypothetical protein
MPILLLKIFSEGRETILKAFLLFHLKYFLVWLVWLWGAASDGFTLCGREAEGDETARTPRWYTTYMNPENQKEKVGLFGHLRSVIARRRMTMRSWQASRVQEPKEPKKRRWWLKGGIAAFLLAPKGLIPLAILIFGPEFLERFGFHFD